VQAEANEPLGHPIAPFDPQQPGQVGMKSCDGHEHNNPNQIQKHQLIKVRSILGLQRVHHIARDVAEHGSHSGRAQAQGHHDH
jgi:hypothetical protein